MPGRRPEDQGPPTKRSASARSSKSTSNSGSSTDLCGGRQKKKKRRSTRGSRTSRKAGHKGGRQYTEQDAGVEGAHSQRPALATKPSQESERRPPAEENSGPFLEDSKSQTVTSSLEQHLRSGERQDASSKLDSSSPTAAPFDAYHYLPGGPFLDELLRQQLMRDTDPRGLDTSVPPTQAGSNIVEQSAKRARFSFAVKWKELGLSPTPQRSHPLPGQKATQPPNAQAVALALVVLTVVLLLTLVLVVFSLVQFSYASRSRLCETSDCRFHAHLVVGGLNKSLDPCEDFAAFVCSAWKPMSHYVDGEVSTRADVVQNFASHFNSSLAKDREIPAARQAHDLLTTCLNKTAYGAEGRHVISQFLADEGVPWPRPAVTSLPVVASPFRVLLRFALKWRLPLWFDVRVLTSFAGGKRAVVISDNPQLRYWAALHRRLLAEGEFHKYWLAHYNLLAPQERSNDTQPAFAINASVREAQLQSDVFQALLGDREGKTSVGAMVTLDEVEANTTCSGSAATGVWAASLTELTAIWNEVPFRASDVILLRDVGLLLALERLACSHDATELLEAIGWLLAQILAPVVDFGILRFRNKGDANADDRHSLFCARQVEEIYRPLLIGLVQARAFPEKVRLAADDGLNHIRDTALPMTVALPWLETSAKSNTQLKIDSSRRLLWLPSSVPKNISTMYNDFVARRSYDTFADAWVDSRSIPYNLSATNRDTLDMAANLVLPLADYDYMRNTVRVSIQALSRPVFYPEGTTAMFYGGLGITYAAELVRSVDQEGMSVHYNGSFASSWASTGWKSAVADRVACLAAQSDDGHGPKAPSGPLFPVIPALEMAYTALANALARDPQPIHLVQSFTERQIFFITFCYLLCAGRPGTSLECNRAVRNFPQFGRDFGCTLGAKMRPEKPCTFLFNNATNVAPPIGVQQSMALIFLIFIFGVLWELHDVAATTCHWPFQTAIFWCLCAKASNFARG
ncbi:neprilysin-like [Haemaphysalis longicornis]